jgi:hypothetical protein
MSREVPGQVDYTELRTSIGTLLIDSDECVDTIEISSYLDVVLRGSLNHRSEDVKVDTSFRFAPSHARQLGRLLIDAADYAENQRERKDSRRF